MGNFFVHYHNTIPYYEYTALNEDGSSCNNGSRIFLPTNNILDIKISDTSMMMEVMYESDEDYTYRWVNLVMVPNGHKIPEGFCFLKTIEYTSILYGLFVRMEKTEEEEKIDFREERIEKLLNKNKEDEND